MKTAFAFVSLVALIALAGISLARPVLVEAMGAEAFGQLFATVTTAALGAIALIGGMAYWREKKQRHDD